jgi:hypothetical protein
VYRKGSFPVKEPYSCPQQAELRLEALMAERWYANLVAPDPAPELQKLLDCCVEIPPPR